MRQVEAPSTGIGVSRPGKDLQPPYNVVITGGTKGVHLQRFNAIKDTGLHSLCTVAHP